MVHSETIGAPPRRSPRLLRAGQTLLVLALLVSAGSLAAPRSALAAEAGVNASDPTGRQLTDVRALGTHWVRTFLSWPALQPTSGPLDPGVLAGAADPDQDRGLGVEQRVGDQLGDAQLGALDEIGPVDVRAGVDHPTTCVLHATGTRAQRQGWPVQRHGVSPKNASTEISSLFFQVIVGLPTRDVPHRNLGP